MGLSRKRQREFNRLKRQTEDLLHEQREILDNASRVMRDASRQAANFAREEVSPKVRDAYDDNVRPAIRSGVRSAKSAASSGRDRFVEGVLPAVTSAIGSALAAIESAAAPVVHDTAEKVSRTARKAGSKVGIVEPPRSASGPAKYIVLGVALVAAAGVAYAAWQTLRADDSLWIEDEPENELVEAEA